jgi:hypothetical protein
MSLLQTIWTDLREKRLWPVAVALIAAIVAVPVVLAKTAKPPASTQPPTSTTPSPIAGLPIISVNTNSASGSLKGVTKRDPFSQQKSAVTTTTSASPTTTTGATTTGSGASGSGATGSTGSTTTGGSSGTPTSTTPTTPTLTPNPPFTGLTDKQSYDVALALSDARGGFVTTDPLVRLSPLPSAQRPLLIELGVLKGGHRVLFVVQPGTVVSGPGVCAPGPIDCQILSLAENQNEQLSVQGPSGLESVALFSVTGISVDQHPSTSAADEARRAVSAAGQRVLAASTLSALSLFEYDPSTGVVLDQRNLTVGGGS